MGSFFGRWFLSSKKDVMPEPKVYPLKELAIDEDLIAPQARMIVKTLQSKGYQAYIVGGAVRDLLLKKQPKDFDIVSSATPDQIRQLFRSSRVVGRRFRIAHVTLDRVIYEVSTLRKHGAKKRISSFFSRKQVDKQGFIIQDNDFGKSLSEDVWGRDLTLNALYLDPVANTVHDFFRGVEDIKNKRLVMIGEPKKRFLEDPVRLIRMVRFSAQLHFPIPKEFKEVIRENANLLSKINISRLFEEFRKLFINIQAMSIMNSLYEEGLLLYLLPLLEKNYPLKRVQSLLKQVFSDTKDRIIVSKVVHPAFLLAAFFWVPFDSAVKKLKPKLGKYTKAQLLRAFDRLLEQNGAHTYTQAIKERVFQIYLLQFQMQVFQPKSKEAETLERNLSFRAAYDFMMLRAKVGELEKEEVEKWHEHYVSSESFRKEYLKNKHIRFLKRKEGSLDYKRARKVTGEKRNRSRY